MEREMVVAGLVLLTAVLAACSPPEAGQKTPENITVHLIDANTAQVFWSSSWKNVERYDVTYNPTENRIVSQAAGNSQSVVLRELRPDTQYQVTVTAVVGGKSYRSRRLVFRTGSNIEQGDNEESSWVKPSPTKAAKAGKSFPATPEVVNPDPTAVGSKYTPQTSTTVRGVEIGLVLLALVVWIIAIALFFHRWGKIRMLLPYQPDYKTQQSLKVPGTGTTIVSGCSGSNTAQGQQEGPGCVQHLRWSSRCFDEPAAAKKCSPSRWSLRPRVSSAIFPASPSCLYARASAECDSPKMLRHARSHGELQVENISLCQVNQPRSENLENVISIKVPVIASTVNEKTLTKKNGEVAVKRTSSDPKNLKMNPVERNDRTENASDGHWNEKRTAMVEDYEGVFMVESTQRGLREEKDMEKPRRYNKSSLKKQKVRLCDDQDSEIFTNVPKIDRHENVQEPQTEKTRKPKDQKTAEIKRKTFLRKVSLQDTYLNYNQDYWLDFRKSGRFHKSIDLGYLGNEDPATAEPEGNKSLVEADLDPEPKEAHPSGSSATKSNQTNPAAITRQSKPPSHFRGATDLKKCGSDPLVFVTRRSSCKNCGWPQFPKDSSELFSEMVGECRSKDFNQRKGSWFFLPSNENIPLFFERNGFIETDFDVLNQLSRESSQANLDFSDFHEIKLTGEPEREVPKRHVPFDFEGGAAFFGQTQNSMSEDSEKSPEDGERSFPSYSVHPSPAPLIPTPPSHSHSNQFGQRTINQS